MTKLLLLTLLLTSCATTRDPDLITLRTSYATFHTRNSQIKYDVDANTVTFPDEGGSVTIPLGDVNF